MQICIVYLDQNISETRLSSTQIVCRFSSFNWVEGTEGLNQKPFIVGNIFWNNAISSLSSWCQVIRGFKLLCIVGIQTK